MGERRVTSICASLFKPFNSDEIIMKILKSNKMTDPDYEYYGCTKEDILKKWKESTEEGTRLHKDIENYYQGINPKVITKEFVQFLSFVQDHNNFIYFKSEWKIFFPKHKITGIIDMVYQLSDGKYAIYDWKRSKNINYDYYTDFSIHPLLKHIPNTNYYHYSLQLNFYKYILEKEYNMIISEMMLCCLHPNNDNYILYPVHDFTDLIEGILNNN